MFKTSLRAAAVISSAAHAATIDEIALADQFAAVVRHRRVASARRVAPEECQPSSI